MKRAMRSRWTGRLSIAMLFFATAVFAQDGEKKDGEKKGAEVKLRKTSQLSAAEQLAQTAKYVARMKQTLASVGKLAKRARVEKDIIKLNCVNDKQIQIKGNLRLAEQTRDAIKVASARGDAGARDHEFSKLTIAFQKVTVLGQEAEACIGQEIAYVGQTKVDVSVDPDIPQEDPTTEAPPPLPTIRPPVASPFQ